MINPSLPSVVDRAIRTRLRSLRVGMPARVTSYDPAKRRVSVKPLLMEAYVDPTTGERDVDSVPVITDVPVAFPRAGSYRIEFPLEAGVTGWLWFADRSLDRWLASGGEVDPGDDRDHSLTDAVFYPGVQAFGSAPDDAASTECMSIGVDGGPVIEVDGDEIRIGGAGAEALAKNSDLNNLRQHVATLLVGGAGSAVHPSPPAAYTGTTVAKGK